MAEQAINVIYKLAEHPDIICGDILKRLAHVVMATGQDARPDDTPLASQSEINPMNEEGENKLQGRQRKERNFVC